MKSEILYPGAFPMVRVDLAAGEHIKAESGAMVACSPTIDIESKMEGGFLGGADAIVIESKMQSLSRGLLGGEGFFILKISGKGLLILNSFGAIHKIELKPDQEYIVDNSHLVAWSSTTSYNIEKATSGWVASFTSGEGFVCRFRGPGLVYIQSRNPGSFGAWIRQFIPVSE